jgi:D-amino-acid oxidase
MRRVIVVGAGVVGLSCAARLLEAGHRVDVLARDLPLETTSAVAAALWYPYRALPQDRVTAWSATSYDAFRALAGDDGTGVRMLSGTEVLHEPRADPVVGGRGAGAGAHSCQRVPGRVDVHGAGGRDAGLPALAGGAR